MERARYRTGTMRYRVPLCLFGPTASGKTALAVRLAQRLNGVIINADSLQVYAGCPTLTAQPSTEDRAAADHRLFGVRSVADPIDVVQWLVAAKAEAERVQRAGRMPIFCGGTGFYLKALAEGLSTIPPVGAQALEAAKRRLEHLGLQEFETEVLGADPALNGRFARADRQRLLRAWSVWRATGQPLSHWWEQPKQGGIGAICTFAIVPNRADLYAQIDARFQRMLAAGALQEVADLAHAHADPQTLPLAQALGFRELLAVIRDQLSVSEATRRACQMSRNYAKRQLTWVRNQCKSAIKLPCNRDFGKETESMSDLIVLFMRQNVC